MQKSQFWQQQLPPFVLRSLLSSGLDGPFLPAKKLSKPKVQS